MQLQDFIVANLLDSAKNIDFTDLKSIEPLKGRWNRELQEAIVKGDKKGKIFFPRKACDFIVTVDFAPGTIMFLKSFSFPEAGVQYSMDEETIWFPKPTFNVQMLSLGGYIQRNINTTFFRWYESQFNSGLLSLKPGPSIQISAVQIWDDFDSDLDLLGGSHALVSGLLEPLNLKASMAENLKEVLDLRAKGIVVPLYTLKNCKISYPKLSPDPASNEFAVLNTTVAYTNFETHF